MQQEIRKKAIERYLNGEAPISIYTDLERSKYWFFKWLKQYKTGSAILVCAEVGIEICA